MAEPVDLASALAAVDAPWSPLTVALKNDDDVWVVKTRGEFTRHAHPETDELFLVVRGELTIRMDDGEVRLGPGQLYVVPRGVLHQPGVVGGRGRGSPHRAQPDHEHRGHPQPPDGGTTGRLARSSPER